MQRVLRKSAKDLTAVAVLVALACGIGFYILQEQRLRIPVLEESPFVVKAEFSTAQAVVPGQGQTIRVAGVRVGDIRSTELVDGRAVIEMELDREFDDLVRTNATAFLRPKTGLKDMFVELNPGTKDAPVAPEGFTLPISSTLPDVNPDEILGALDADTRDYLKLLISGAGKGLDGRGEDLRDVLKRFEPTYHDLAAVTRETGKRRVELRRLVRSLNLLNSELADNRGDVSELIQVSSRVFRQFATERDSVEALARELPGALQRTRDALANVRDYARVLRPAADDLRPVARALKRTNEAVTPFAREAAPILRTQVRPFVQTARPTVRRLAPVADDLHEAEPVLTRSLTVLNHFFNMLGHNPRGAEAAGKAGRDEGFLFSLAWLGHLSTNLFSNADAHGPMRSLTLSATCTTLRATLAGQPQAEQLFGLSGLLTDPRICGGPSGAAANARLDRRIDATERRAAAKLRALRAKEAGR
ncbi:MAG TPA: MlaD family protein [Baekduia sp.]|nr:MlaD family protein [Baekduia sp.]